MRSAGDQVYPSPQGPGPPTGTPQALRTHSGPSLCPGALLALPPARPKAGVSARRNLAWPPRPLRCALRSRGLTGHSFIHPLPSRLVTPVPRFWSAGARGQVLPESFLCPQHRAHFWPHAVRAGWVTVEGASRGGLVMGGDGPALTWGGSPPASALGGSLLWCASGCGCERKRKKNGPSSAA